ncbi:MAG: AccI family restriction endonuclease [Euryarchaeota archaeon]|nr:AccI family restriction endonuclease [Euryarchaeota archaeon]
MDQVELHQLGDVREFELYFERLDKAGLGKIKRPDLLIFKKNDQKLIESIIKDSGGIEELSFIREAELKEILDKSLIAVECENSLWKAEKMPDFNSELKPYRRLGGKLGLKKNAVLPTVILKEEDMKSLLNWQNSNNIKIYIWHVFYDRAYGLLLNEAQRLIDEGLIELTVQTFQAPGGATTKKGIYKFYHHYAYPLGISEEEPKLESAYIEDKNGHILPYVKFKGGKLKLLPAALKVLEGSEQR